MLQVSELRAGYGRMTILNGINLEVADGEFVGVLGHNGMGKTTFLKATKKPPYERARRGIGYVPQGRDIFPQLSVNDNLRMGITARKVREDQVIEPILEAFPRLKPLLQRRGGALSGGEQQILAIARCLCGEPKLVLLDEPTEGIQPSIIDEIVEVLQRLHDSRNLTMILVEQNLDFIAALARRVLIIQRGAFTQQVTPAQLADPDVVAEFIGTSQ
jgi:branched-chain amino acid transport system ATP-binding protein